MLGGDIMGRVRFPLVERLTINFLPLLILIAMHVCVYLRRRVLANLPFYCRVVKSVVWIS